MLLVFVYLIHLFHLIVVALFSFCVSLSLCVASVVITLIFMPGLYSAVVIGLPLLRSPLRSVLCGCLLFVSSACALFVFSVSCSFILFIFCLFCVPSCTATMSLADYFLVPSLLSAFPAFLKTHSRFYLVWFRLSCDRGWIRSGLVNVR